MANPKSARTAAPLTSPAENAADPTLTSTPSPVVPSDADGTAPALTPTPVVAVPAATEPLPATTPGGATVTSSTVPEATSVAANVPASVMSVGPAHPPTANDNVAEQMVAMQRKVEELEASNSELRRQLDDASRLLADYHHAERVASEAPLTDGRLVTPTNPHTAERQVWDAPPSTLGGPAPINPPLT